MKADGDTLTTFDLYHAPTTTNDSEEPMKRLTPFVAVALTEHLLERMRSAVGTLWNSGRRYENVILNHPAMYTA